MIKIQNNSLIIDSGITKSEFQRVRMYAPEALTVTDSEGNQVYTLDTSSSPKIKSFGLGCNNVVDGKLIAITLLPADVEDPKEFVKHQFANGFMAASKYLPVIRTQVTKALEAVDKIEIVME